MAVKQTVFVVMQEGVADPIDAKLTLAAAVSVCKLAPGRRWKKLIATKEHGTSRSDTTAKQ